MWIGVHDDLKDSGDLTVNVTLAQVEGVLQIKIYVTCWLMDLTGLNLLFSNEKNNLKNKKFPLKDYSPVGSEYKDMQKVSLIDTLTGKNTKKKPKDPRTIQRPSNPNNPNNSLRRTLLITLICFCFRFISLSILYNMFFILFVHVQFFFFTLSSSIFITISRYVKCQ